MSAIWGNNVKISIFGDNYENGVGVTIDGLPSGQKINYEEISIQMARHSSNSNASLGNRKEDEDHRILSGISNDHTSGAPLCAVIKNRKSSSSFQSSVIPSHNINTEYNKNMRVNYQSPSRELPNSDVLTAPLTFAGSVCRQILETKNIRISAHIYSIGNIYDAPFDPNKISDNLLKNLSCQAFPVIHHEIESAMKSELESTKMSGDSTIGIVECVVCGIDKDMSTCMFDGAKNSIASIIFGIPGVIGIEFCSQLSFPQKHINSNTRFKENNISNASISPLIFRVSVKLSSKDNLSLQNQTQFQSLNSIQRIVPTIESAVAVSMLDII